MRRRRISCAAAALAVGLAAVGGCASRSSGSLTGRFIKQGEPTVTYGKSRRAPADSLQEQMAKVRHLSAAARTRHSTFGATIEGSDRRLAAALLMEAVLPTAESHLQVAEEYRRLGILDAAHARLNRALQRNPQLAAAHESMARVWRDWGLPDLGLGAAYRATHYAPASASAHNTLGTILDAIGQRDAARRAYELAVMLEPSAVWALSNLCYLEFSAGRLAQARGQCEAALRVEPGFAAAHNNLGLVYAAAGDMTRAQQEFRAAGSAAVAQYNLGIAHLAAGSPASAARAFDAAIEANPAFAAASERARAARGGGNTGRE